MNAREVKFTSEQKKAVALLSVGTFLEAFDLLLYVHMAIVLNDLFFPITNPVIKSFTSAFSLCSTYLLRPFGALLFGWIGDTLGRKSIIVTTTTLMAVCCITIALLPTYQQIGIAAPIILTICRMMQGISSSSEILGAQIYLTESFKPPIQYPLVASITLLGAIGPTAAIGVGIICTSAAIFSKEQMQYSWRYAFIFGAIVGVIGTVARHSLREAKDFVDRKELRKALIEKGLATQEKLSRVSFKTCLAFFLIQCGTGPCFYFTFIYCSDVLKDSFCLSNNAILLHNFWASVVEIFAVITVMYLSFKVNPVKIVKIRALVFFLSMLCFPIFMDLYNSTKTVFLFQLITSVVFLDDTPAGPIFFRHFPVYARFRYAAILRSTANALMSVITGFGIVLLVKPLGYKGVLVIMTPSFIGFWLFVRYFEKLELKSPTSIISARS